MNYNKRRQNGNNKSNAKNSYNSKTNTRRDSKRTEDSESSVKDIHNDWAWYVESPQLLKDVASLPFAQVAGMKTGLVDDNSPAHSSFADYIPGIMVIGLAPSLGCGKTAVDATTIAARKIYSFVRHANSGSANYEAPDLMLTILAYISAEAWLQNLKRVYGVAQMYYTRNRYFTDSMIKAMGFDPTMIRSNLAQLRAFINITAMRLNKVKVPKGLPLLERWKFLSGNYFMDDDDIKAQVYLPRFEYYWKFDGYGSETGTQLVRACPKAEGAVTQFSTITDIQEIYDFTNSLIDPLVSEEDVGIMSGDIMKAFGENVSVEELISEDYAVAPTTDRNVLMQIHNCITPFATESLSRYDSYLHYIGQQNGVIVERFHLKGKYKEFTQENHKFYLDMYTPTPTPEEVIVATRLRAVTGPITTASTDYDSEVAVSGTEIPLYYQIISDTKLSNTYASVDNILGTLGVRPLSRAADFSVFNWHPLLYIMDSKDETYEGVLGDIENYTVLHDDTISAMHKVAVLAELRTSMDK